MPGPGDGPRVEPTAPTARRAGPWHLRWREVGKGYSVGNRQLVSVAAALFLATALPLGAAAGEGAKTALGEWYRPLKGISLGPGSLDVGGSVRARYEVYDNFSIRRYNTRFTDDALFARLRLNFDYHFSESAHAFVMLQDSHFWFNRLHVGDFPGSCPYQNPLDLRQAYFEWQRIGDSPWGFKIGRQAISYRDKRIFGPGEWGNVGRYAWDAAKITFETDAVRIDAFAAQRVLFDPRRFDSRHFGFDAYAVYAQVKKLPVDLDLFYVLKYDDHGTTVGESGVSDEKRHTFGLYWGRSPGKGLDYGATTVVQCGRYGGDDIRAYGYNNSMGYTFDAPWSPRIGVELSYASGDHDPTDGDHETFDNVFGAVDCFYGRMNLFAWKNLADYQATFSVKPTKKMKIWLDYHFFRLAEDSDAWYYCSGRPQRRDPTGHSGSTLGHELDLMLKWKMTDDLELFTGYAHFFPGGFIKHTPGGHDDAGWAFVQLLYRF